MWWMQATSGSGSLVFFNMQLTLAINGQLQCCLFLISPLQIGNCANDGVKVLKLKPSTSEFNICSICIDIEIIERGVSILLMADG